MPESWKATNTNISYLADKADNYQMEGFLDGAEDIIPKCPNKPSPKSFNPWNYFPEYLSDELTYLSLFGSSESFVLASKRIGEAELRIYWIH